MNVPIADGQAGTLHLHLPIADGQAGYPNFNVPAVSAHAGYRSTPSARKIPSMTELRTTEHLEALWSRHASTIESLIERYNLPLHLFFVERMAAEAAGFFAVRDRLYPNMSIAFAVKSNPCRGAVRTASRLGLGTDVASEYELQAALEEQVPPQSITCNGNAKSSRYLTMAVRAGAPIMVDNRDELDMLADVCQAESTAASISLRFRGMPLSGLTSDDQSTAADWTKFGFHVDEANELFSRVRGSAHLEFLGISAHIGTQISRPAGYERLLTRFFALIEQAAEASLTVSRVNIGGGFPARFLTDNDAQTFQRRLLDRLEGRSNVSDAVTWTDLPYGYEHVLRGAAPPYTWVGKAYWTDYPGSQMLEHVLQQPIAGGKTTIERLRDLGEPTLIVEPGRSLSAPAGITTCRVMGVKTVLGHPVIALDMGINNHGTNLIAPDIFPAAIVPRRAGDRPVEAFLAGRLCFSGDMISKAKVPLNRMPKRGDLLVLYHTGAYGADHFASHSCGFPRPAKVAIREDGTAELWRRKEEFADVFGDPSDLLSAD